MSRPKIVLLGMLTKIPVGGVMWLVRQYAVGFERLGYDVYYVEAHGRVPSMFMEHEYDDPTGKAVTFLADQMRRNGMEDRWAFHAVHDDGRCYGLSTFELDKLYRDAALIINLHGGTVPLEEHSASGRLVYMGTDPVELELELYREERHAIEFLEPHVAFFTWGLNYGNPDCRLPWSERFNFVPSLPPVVLDLWQDAGGREDPAAFTTVGNWRQPWRKVTFDGEVYTWSKHHEFLKILDLPGRVDQRFELALSSFEEADRRLLEGKGWAVRSGLEVSADPESYRSYIADSRGELTVAKDQNVRLRTGWFSERSATYLAAGRPVIQQDTGFGNAFPTGKGVFGFADLDGAVVAVEAVNADYAGNRRAATEVAREFFNYDVVLGGILDHVGLGRSGFRTTTEGAVADERSLQLSDQLDNGIGLPGELHLLPRSRRPLVLDPETQTWADGIGGVAQALGRASFPSETTSTDASVVVVTWNHLPLTKLCLTSLMAGIETPPYEVIVVDNGSTDGTVEYLRELAGSRPGVRVVLNDTNRGFPTAVNQGLASATGSALVLLNNDTVVAPGSLDRLLRHLSADPGSLVGPVTNRIGTAAEVPTNYTTVDGYLAEARARAEVYGDSTFPIDMLAMFCLVLTRTAWEAIGPLDERYGVGLLEDDDYSERATRAGFRLRCAPDVLIHHFGEASFGDLLPSGEHSSLLHSNKGAFERKWDRPWRPYRREVDSAYAELREAVRALAGQVVRASDRVAVVSRGDDDLLDLPVASCVHFPCLPDGTYGGHHPANSEEAVQQLEILRSRGYDWLIVPSTSGWWLEHYHGFAEYLDRNGILQAESPACRIYQFVEQPAASVPA